MTKLVCICFGLFLFGCSNVTYESSLSIVFPVNELKAQKCKAATVLTSSVILEDCETAKTIVCAQGVCGAYIE